MCIRSFTGYRGTTKAWGIKCETENNFCISRGQDEYFGHGIYFFENDFNEAKNWILKARKVDKDNACVIKSIIEVENERIFDMLLSEHQQEFLKLLDVFDNKIKKFEIKINREIPYDCCIFNIIIDKGNIDLVRGVYCPNNKNYQFHRKNKHTRMNKYHIQLCVANKKIIKQSVVTYLESTGDNNVRKTNGFY